MFKGQRTLDVLLSTIGLIVCGPLVGLAAGYVFLLSGGVNPLFIQKRVGRHQIMFNILKIRTMHKATPTELTHKLGRDSLLPYCQFIRKLKIDELPQLVNVLLGDMSIVGPRPGLPADDKLITLRKNKNLFIYAPGITGFAQVESVGMDRPEKMTELDIKTELLDTKVYLKLIFSTFYKIIK